VYLRITLWQVLLSSAGEEYLAEGDSQVLLSSAGEEYLAEGDSQVHLSGSSTPLRLFYGHNLIILSKFSAGVLGSERCTRSLT
jgi:hypothetical protein